MPVITLTTDLGYRDPFLGRIKAKIYEHTKGRIPVFDLSHEVSPFNLHEAAYIIGACYKDFPKESVHLIGVDAQSSPEQPHVVMHFDHHYFVGADNGVFSLLIGDQPFDKMIRVDVPQLVETTFPEREILVPVATHLVGGGSMDLLGTPMEYPREMVGVRPQIAQEGGVIRGHVIYIDRLGNVVTNIRRDDFEARRGGRNYEIRIRNHTIPRVHDHYHARVNFELDPGDRKGSGHLVALFNSNDLLEVCLYRSDQNTVGGASGLLGMEYRDQVTIEFL